MRAMLALAAGVAAAGCTESPPAKLDGPSFDKEGIGRPTVLVNPRIQGNGSATTIQEGIDMVGEGGRVMVMSGLYEETLVIDKGLTLEALGDGAEPVVIAPPGAPTIAVQVATSQPVTIRDLTLRFGGANGIRGDGASDLTVEHVSLVAEHSPVGRGYMLSVVNDPGTQRARLVVRGSFLDGGIPNFVPGTTGIPQMFGLVAQGDVDARFEGNLVRRSGGACILVLMRADGRGVSNAAVIDNDVDECHPTGRVASIIVGAPATLPTTQVTATGRIDLIGNLIRNSDRSLLPASGIFYDFGNGVIADNTVSDFVQPTTTAARGLPAAIYVGSSRRIGGVFLPRAEPVVRFNDIAGNAQAGLRVGPNQTSALDAGCNWWGSASGPSGKGPGTGDAIVVEGAAATPTFAPWATAPVAGTQATTC